MSNLSPTNPSSSDSNLSDNKRCYSSSSTSNFEESTIIISESHENLNREDYLIKRKKNNASARKCREKRKKQMAGNFKDAASTLDFNRFIRKEVLHYYQSMNYPVPNDSELFRESNAAAYLDSALRSAKVPNEKTPENNSHQQNKLFLAFRQHQIFSTGEQNESSHDMTQGSRSTSSKSSADSSDSEPIKILQRLTVGECHKVLTLR